LRRVALLADNEPSAFPVPSRGHPASGFRRAGEGAPNLQDPTHTGKKRPMKIRRLVAPIAGFALVTAVATVSPAELAKWDPDRVAALGEDLQKAVNDLYQEFYKRPSSNIGSGQAKSYYRLKQTLRRLRSETRAFSKALTSGKSQEETSPIYDQLMTLVRSAREDARKTFLDDTILNKAAAAGDVLRRIAPYYDAEAATNPDLQPMKDAAPGK